MITEKFYLEFTREETLDRNISDFFEARIDNSAYYSSIISNSIVSNNVFIDWEAGNIQKFSITSSTTVNFEYPPRGLCDIVLIIENTSGNYILAFSNLISILWEDKAPSCPPVGDFLLIDLYYDGSQYYASYKTYDIS